VEVEREAERRAQPPRRLPARAPARGEPVLDLGEVRELPAWSSAMIGIVSTSRRTVVSIGSTRSYQP
jgi:hypothetical protein